MQEKKCKRFVLHVVIHNLKGYDSFNLKHFAKNSIKCQEINVMASSSEPNISFENVFFSSFQTHQFTACSLDELVSNLEPAQFVQTVWRHYVMIINHEMST